MQRRTPSPSVERSKPRDRHTRSPSIPHRQMTSGDWTFSCIRRRAVAGSVSLLWSPIARGSTLRFRSTLPCLGCSVNTKGRVVEKSPQLLAGMPQNELSERLNRVNKRPVPNLGAWGALPGAVRCALARATRPTLTTVGAARRSGPPSQWLFSGPRGRRGACLASPPCRGGCAPTWHNAGSSPE